MRSGGKSGDVVGRFRLDVHIGAGGMGSVWRAVDEDTGSVVAVKLTDPRKRFDPQHDRYLARFRRESHGLKQATADPVPYIVTWLDDGEDPRFGPYLVMEFVDGRPLSSVGHPIDRNRVQRWSEQLFGALSLMASADLVHRDLKPSNVVVVDEHTPEPNIKLIDFGLVRETASTVPTMAVGTLGFIPPEYAAGRPPSFAGDVYSAGCVLYWLAAGKAPFTVDPAHPIRRDTDVVAPLIRPDLPDGFEPLVRRMFAYRDEDRPDAVTAWTELSTMFGGAPTRLIGDVRELPTLPVTPAPTLRLVEAPPTTTAPRDPVHEAPTEPAERIPRRPMASTEVNPTAHPALASPLPVALRTSASSASSASAREVPPWEALGQTAPELWSAVNAAPTDRLFVVPDTPEKLARCLLRLQAMDYPWIALARRAGAEPDLDASRSYTQRLVQAVARCRPEAFDDTRRHVGPFAGAPVMGSVREKFEMPRKTSVVPGLMEVRIQDLTDLSGLDLSGGDLRSIRGHINFSSSNLVNARLDHCDLESSSFDDADLRGAGFRSCVLSSVAFRGADLRKAVFRDRVFVPVSTGLNVFADADLRGADLSGLGTTSDSDVSDGNYAGARWDEETVWPGWLGLLGANGKKTARQMRKRSVKLADGSYQVQK